MLSDEEIILDFIFAPYLDNTKETEMTAPYTRPAKDSLFAREFPAVTGETIQQGHADYCKLWGHATYWIDGEPQILCPRCGDNKCHPTHNTDCGV